MSWTKITHATEATGGAYGTQAWGTTAYGGGAGTSWTEIDKATSTWTKQSEATDSWTTVTKAS